MNQEKSLNFTGNYFYLMSLSTTRICGGHPMLIRDLQGMMEGDKSKTK